MRAIKNRPIFTTTKKSDKYYIEGREIMKLRNWRNYESQNFLISQFPNFVFLLQLAEY